MKQHLGMETIFDLDRNFFSSILAQICASNVISGGFYAVENCHLHWNTALLQEELFKFITIALTNYKQIKEIIEK